MWNPIFKIYIDEWVARPFLSFLILWIYIRGRRCRNLRNPIFKMRRNGCDLGSYFFGLRTDFRVLNTRVYILGTRVYGLGTRVYILETRVYILETRVYVLETRVYVLETRVYILRNCVRKMYTRVRKMHISVHNSRKCRYIKRSSRQKMRGWKREIAHIYYIYMRCVQIMQIKNTK